MRTVRAVIVVFVVFSAMHSAAAFNQPGHMAVGAIAYKTLKDTNPTALAEIVATPKKHPHYRSMWKDQLASVLEEDRDLVLFMLAARWPDDIRKNPEYHHGTWHYINYPFKPAGESASLHPPEPTTADDINRASIVQAFRHNAGIAQDNAPKADKAVALCWILHLVGDVHQPLHTVALFTADYPRGDHGGNAFYIREDNRGPTIPLHQFWDALVLTSGKFGAVKNRVTEMCCLNPRNSFPELSQAVALTQFEIWAKDEGPPLARELVYRNGELQGSVDEEDGEALPDDYAYTVEPILRRRATLAGYRLAAVLAKLVQP